VAVDVAGVATHVLGWVRARQADDDADPRFVRPRNDPRTGTLDFGHYQPGDAIGGAGVERSRENDLRGLRGRVVRHFDSGNVETIDPVSGRDVSLTIDAQVQAKVQALLEPSVGLARLQPWHLSQNPEQWPKLPLDSPLYGSAVVLEIETGEVVALVSTPSFTRDQRQDGALWRDPVHSPAINKAVSGRYPPGSIIKPLVLTAAVTEGVYSLGQPITCTGHFYPSNPNIFRCWIYKQSKNTRTHSEFYPEGLHAPEALAASCNIFFYTLGSKLGLERLSGWYRRFGIGDKIDLGLGGEYAGFVRESAGDARGHLSDAVNMAIGQGPVDYTPMHAADIYATIARWGQRIKPRLMMDERPVASELHLDTGAVDAAIKGLGMAVGDEMGTGHHLSLEGGVREPIFAESGVTVCGKTGTADAPDIMGEDPDAAGPLKAVPLREGDHSWFVVMVGPRGKPAKYVIAVLMEYAGSGGRVSGPIANQIIHVLKEEGYL
jgi:penicillin-binding protein 2